MVLDYSGGLDTRVLIREATGSKSERRMGTEQISGRDLKTLVLKMKEGPQTKDFKTREWILSLWNKHVKLKG